MLNTLRQSIWINPEVAGPARPDDLFTSFCFSPLSDSLRSALDVKLVEHRVGRPVTPPLIGARG